VEILDKNIHLAYMEEGARFQAEMVVKRGLVSSSPTRTSTKP